MPHIEELVEESEVDKLEERAALKRAEQVKKEGNDLFKEGKYEESLEKYMSALSACPPSCTRERAVYHCNSAACHVKLKRFALGKEHCDKALVLKQDYVKALMRRILCLEMMDDEEEESDRSIFTHQRKGEEAEQRDRNSNDADSQPKPSSRTEEEKEEESTSNSVASSEKPGAESENKAQGRPKAEDKLQMALDDCEAWLKLEPESSEAKGKKVELEKKMKEKQERMQQEVMGKLKDLGNTILGKFGLSLDNFKAEKDPTTGSYSINFKK